MAAGKPPVGAKESVKKRIVDHKKAYKPLKSRGQHIDLKVTPPEKRGKKGMVLVEIYNNSKKHVSVMEFDLILHNEGLQNLSTHISVEGMWPEWSDVRWVEIPRDGKIPKIKEVEIKNLKMFDEKARPIKIKVYTDLIKK